MEKKSYSFKLFLYIPVKFILLLFLVNPIQLFCQTKKSTGYENIFKYESSALNISGYIVTTPKGYKQSTESQPLFVFLHGFSLKGNNLDKLTDVYGPVAEQKRGFSVPGIVLAPQCSEGSWEYTGVDELIEWTKHNFKVDTTRIYILGMSMGGSGTWICGSRLNHKIAAMVPICGGSYMDLNWTNPCALIKMPIWTFHGRLDKDVLISETEKTVDEIHKCGGGDLLQVTYYPNKGHDLAFLFKDPKVYQWLLTHVKTDFQNYWREETIENTPDNNDDNNAPNKAPETLYNFNNNQSDNNSAPSVYKAPDVPQPSIIDYAKLSGKWSVEQLSNCYPSNTNSMSEFEIEVIRILNLARLYPNLFVQYEILDKREKFNFNSEYVNSLIIDLKNMIPVSKLNGSVTMKRIADCFVREQGITGHTGHDRSTCSKGFFGECISYGMNSPLEVIIQLLVDQDVVSLGHRIICLSDKYISIGVSNGYHLRYEQMTVLDFDIPAVVAAPTPQNYPQQRNPVYVPDANPYPRVNAPQPKYQPNKFSGSQSLNQNYNTFKTMAFCSLYSSPTSDYRDFVKAIGMNAGVEFEVPFNKFNRYFFGSYIKAAAFLLSSETSLKAQFDFEGISNENNYMVVPNAEFGFILFRAIKLGVGGIMKPYSSSLKYEPYCSGALGFKMDEYEIEFGSLLFGNLNRVIAYPTLSLKIRPKK